MRLFTTYDGGRASYGLLLLRLVLASGTLTNGMLRLEFAWQSSAADAAFAGAVAAALGWFVATAFVAIGFLSTPTLGPVALVHGAAIVSRLWAGHLDETATLVDVLMHTMMAGVAIALTLTGPGAYSVDARRCGRREIILPTP